MAPSLAHGPQPAPTVAGLIRAPDSCLRLFIDSYLTDDAREASHKGLPGIGVVGAPGSASFMVSQGRAGSTVSTVLIAAGAVAGAAMVAFLLVVTVVARSVLRRKRSPPTLATVELEPGTLKLEPAAAPEVAIA